MSDNAPIGDIDHDNRWAFSNYTSSLPRFSEHPRGVCASHVSRVPLFAILWTIASQAPLSMGFSRKEYWSGLPFPFPEDLPHTGIEPRSLAFWADYSLFEL